MDKAYGDERNPLIEKSEFILSLFEQLVGAGGVSAKEKSILDRCTYDVYREYMANNYEGEAPTLKDLYHSLLKQPEPEARGLALSSELFITGSLNTFAQHTNVDTKARIIAYDTVSYTHLDVYKRQPKYRPTATPTASREQINCRVESPKKMDS